MKLLLTLPVVVPSILAFCGVALARTTDDPPKSMQDVLRPGAPHALLQKLAGTWDVVLISHDATGKEVRTRGTKTTTKHTDFHTLDTFDGEFMGMRLLGHGVNGFCATRQQYFTFWTDSMTPSPMVVYGDYDATRRELSMRGECFGMSGKLEPCRTLTRFVDDDHVSWSLFGALPDGSETELLRIESTRRR